MRPGADPGALPPPAALADWLRGRGLIGADETLDVTPLAGGQSNPTWRLRAGRASMVLRTQPAGRLVPGAHAIDREHRVLTALQDADVPVPRTLGWCADPSVIGRPFYLMSFLDGRVVLDPTLPGLDPAHRTAVHADLLRVMAALHAVDVDAAGLGDFGRRGGYVARQVARWSRQLQAATVPVPDALCRLMAWLPEHLPADDESTLVHGDFRLDNVVLHPVEPRVIGVLDWELSTLGDPLADFAYHLMTWRVPAALWRGLGGHDLAGLGIPDEAGLRRRYAAATGRTTEALGEFYLAFNLFRMAAILHGIAQRAVDGTATAADAEATGRKAGPLAEIGWDCARRHDAAHRR